MFLTTCSPKVRSEEFLRLMEKRTHGIYEDQIPKDVVKYLLKKKLIKIKIKNKGSHSNRRVVCLNYDIKKKEKKSEPYKKRRQDLKEHNFRCRKSY